MDIKKLRAKAIDIVTKKTKEYQEETGTIKPRLSKKASAYKKLISDFSNHRMRTVLLKLFSELTEENLSLSEDRVEIPVHVMVVIGTEPGKSKERHTFLGSVVLQDMEEGGYNPSLLMDNGRFRCGNDILKRKISFPTKTVVQSFIKGLSDKVIKREFHYLG